MEYLTRTVSDSFIKKIPAGNTHVTARDLREIGVPGFIIRLIELEVGEILYESILAGGTDWIDTDNEVVAEARLQFFRTVSSHLRLPAAHARGIIESAVEVTLETLVRPRVVIPERLFRDDTILSANELERRTERVTVYRHLAMAPVKYLQRKNLGELTVEQCRKIVTGVDEKLVTSYNSMDWGRLVEPLYQLAGESVDPELLKLFYEDKGMPEAAERFDRTDKHVSRLQMIQMLDSDYIPDEPADERVEEKEPESPDYGETLAGKFFTPPDREEAFSDQLISPPEPEERVNSWFGTTPEPEAKKDEQKIEFEKSIEPVEPDRESPEREITDRNKSDGGSVSMEEPDEEAPPIWQQFAPDYEEEEEEEEIIPWFGTDGPDSEEFDTDKQEDFQSEREAQENLPADSRTAPLSDATADDLSDNDPADSGLIPRASATAESLWGDRPVDMISDDSIPENMEEYAEEASQNLHSFWEELERQTYFAEESEEQDSGQGRANDSKDALMKSFGSEKGRYINEIFRGSERAFNQAMADLAVFTTWKDASRYIEKEIFTRNRVDIFTDAAVEFTDQLHGYFSTGPSDS